MHTNIHKVRYYETDKMGIRHRSNYIRWMEEARIGFLEYIGYGYPVCRLCRDHERAGFIERIKIGIQLASELE